MCGRYASFRQAQDLADQFQISLLGPAAERVGPSWNVAPTQNVHIVLESRTDSSGTGASATEAAGPHGPDHVQRRLTVARWGLVPHWAKDPGVGNRMINARRETVAEKPSFKTSLRRRRCLIPADAYYEWQAADEGSGKSAKTPFAIGQPQGETFAFAGLYSWWQLPGQDAAQPDAAADAAVHGEWLLTCTIVTREATGSMTQLHHRVPVILRPEHWDRWLDPHLEDPEEAVAIAGTDLPELAWHEVSRSVNTPRNNEPGLVVPVPDARTGHS